MSTNNPPKEKTPPDPGLKNKTDENVPERSIQSSTAKIMEIAQAAMDVVIECGADIEEANTWLALNLAKTTIQLNPNSNQLNPTKVANMTSKALDI